MKKDIKICISLNKPANSVLKKNPLFIPVYLNSEVEGSQLFNITQGQNIAHKIRNYNELTALYWLWKNIKAEYYGFFQSDQFLSFADKDNQENEIDNLQQISYPYLDELALERFGLTETGISDSLNKTKVDVILPGLCDVSKRYIPFSSPEGHINIPEAFSAIDFYCKNAVQYNSDDMFSLLGLINKQYPEYYEDALTYFNGKCSDNNGIADRLCFIMKKDVFQRFCKWLFEILFKMEHLIDDTFYGEYRLNTFSAMGAILLEIFCINEQRKKVGLKVERAPLICFNDISEDESLMPAYKENNIALVFMSSNYYVPYCSVLVQSVIEHASPKNNYDIIIMQDKDVSEYNKRVLPSMVEGINNISIRFLNPARYLYSYDLRAGKAYGVVTIYRMGTPYVLKNYDKVILTDSDLVFERDPADLYNTDLEGKLLAAVIDDCTLGRMAGASPGRLDYYIDEIGLEKPYDYFNTGVMVWNLKEFRQSFSEEKTLQIASRRQYIVQEQDILNMMAQGRAKYLDRRWNVYVYGGDYDRVYGFTPKKIHDDLMAARQEPFVVHYVGRSVVKPKPWEDPHMDLSEYFWKYARKSPYYEIILHRMTQKQIIDSNVETEQILNNRKGNKWSC